MVNVDEHSLLGRWKIHKRRRFRPVSPVDHGRSLKAVVFHNAGRLPEANLHAITIDH